MIDNLIRKVTDASIGSRTLDVCIHELLTGELDMSESELRELRRADGIILCKHNGENKWWKVPSYTLDIFPTEQFLTARGLSMKITTNTPKMLEVFTKHPSMSHARLWMMSAWEPETNMQVGFATHSTLGLCAALLMLEVVNRPNDALTCDACCKPFVPDDELKAKIKEIGPEALINSVKYCDKCGPLVMLEMQEIAGHG